MKIQHLLPMALLAFGLPGLTHAQELVLTLASPTQSITQGQGTSVLFTGTLTNHSGQDLTLLAGTFAFQTGPATFDSSASYFSDQALGVPGAGDPVVLADGETRSFNLFTVNLMPGAVSGDKVFGIFDYQTVNADFSSGPDASAGFELDVLPADTTAAPEPSTWAAFACTGLGLGGLILRGRQRQGGGGRVASSLLEELR